MNKAAMFRRELTKDDMLRMRILKRYWNVSLEVISDVVVAGGVSLRGVVNNYISNLSEMRSEGAGLLLWGDNGTGKTSAAVYIAKEYRRRGNTVLFMEAADLKSFVAEKEAFDEDETYFQRASTVDVLVLDDIGKGSQDSTGFGARLIDELIRTRNGNKLVTFITTNMAPNSDEMTHTLMPSTLAALKEHVLPIQVKGSDQRERRENWHEKLLLNS